MTTKNILG